MGTRDLGSGKYLFRDEKIVGTLFYRHFLYLICMADEKNVSVALLNLKAGLSQRKLINCLHGFACGRGAGGGEMEGRKEVHERRTYQLTFS